MKKFSDISEDELMLTCNKVEQLYKESLPTVERYGPEFSDISEEELVLSCIAVEDQQVEACEPLKRFSIPKIDAEMAELMKKK